MFGVSSGDEKSIRNGHNFVVKTFLVRSKFARQA